MTSVCREMIPQTGEIGRNNYQNGQMRQFDTN